MGVTTWLVGYLVAAVERGGYLGVFALMALESALVPVPSEAVMPFAGFLVSRGVFGFWETVAAGSLGNLAGSLAAYWLGARYGRPLLERYGRYLLISGEELDAVEEFFWRHGDAAVFLGRLMPAVRTVISFPAGMARMPLARFAALTFLGSVPWNAALTYAGVVLGEHWRLVEELGVYLDAAVVAGVVALALLLLRKRREGLLEPA